MDVPAKEVCYRALQSRDARFDGVIFVGVTSTGIYCRPICPARTPKFANCRFFASASSAQDAGFRPCLRCRPETAPEMASWRGTSNTVSRALSMIAEGALDGTATVAELAERVGVGERQLRRLFLQHLGAAPISVAQTRRVLFAKQLIHDTTMSMSDIASAAGFSSIRRFNETFQALFERPPRELRKETAASGSKAKAGVTIRIGYQPPYDWESMLGFLGARAIPGVEVVENNRYFRTVELRGSCGTIEVFHLPERRSLGVTIRFPDVKALQLIVSRVRRQFDTGADIRRIEAHLTADPVLQSLVVRHSGLRAPGCWDSFELAIRAVLGQQISVAAARRLAGELVALHGTSIPKNIASHPALTHVFPTPKRLAKARALGLKLPLARQIALQEVARVVIAQPALFNPLGTVEQIVERLKTIQGVGEWTAQYIALRAIREMDAFPSSDIGLIRGAEALESQKFDAARLRDRADAWRPWRAYAAQHLWAADSFRSITGNLSKGAR